MQIVLRLRILTQTPFILHLSQRDIIIAMTLLHGTMTGVEVDVLRLPLRKKLITISDLPGHMKEKTSKIVKQFFLRQVCTQSWEGRVRRIG